MKESISLSFELLIETLVGFGFKPIDAQVYIFLAKKGSKRGSDLVNSLKKPNSNSTLASKTYKKKA